MGIFQVGGGRFTSPIVPDPDIITPPQKKTIPPPHFFPHTAHSYAPTRFGAPLSFNHYFPQKPGWLIADSVVVEIGACELSSRGSQRHGLGRQFAFGEGFDIEGCHSLHSGSPSNHDPPHPGTRLFTLS